MDWIPRQWQPCVSIFCDIKKMMTLQKFCRKSIVMLDNQISCCLSLQKLPNYKSKFQVEFEIFNPIAIE